MTLNKPVQIILIAVLALAISACATLQPPGATGPRGSESIYPLLYSADDQRQNATTAAIGRLFQPATPETRPELQPITLTVRSLPSASGQPLYLPKLGTAPVMTEEETRESLRRFIRDWQDLIGADPAKLSLVERVDQPDGLKLATYEHRPFRHPIRGGFGKLQIRFTADRRVVMLSSTCIPDADRIQTLLAGIAPKLKPEDAITQVMGSTITSSGTGTPQTFRPASASQVKVLELVTYIRPSKSKPDALEFHVAWEVELLNSPVKNVYVDAVNGELLVAD